MTLSEEKIEHFHTLVGFDASRRFEGQIARAILDLSESLENNFLDNDTKIDYATHVFAKMLDDLADLLEQPKLVN